MDNVSFPEVKRPGRGFDHPLPSSAEVNERVELYIYSPSGPSWSFLGELYFYFTLTQHFSRQQEPDFYDRGIFN